MTDAERIEQLTAALRLTHAHIKELREAWQRGCISEHDGLGGTRSNRNADLDLAIERAFKGTLDDDLIRRCAAFASAPASAPEAGTLVSSSEYVFTPGRPNPYVVECRPVDSVQVNSYQFEFTVALRKDEGGDIIARVLELPGCMAHGATVDEALARLKEVQDMYLLSLREDEPKQEIPPQMTEDAFLDLAGSSRTESYVAPQPDPVEERPDGWYWVTYKGIVQTSPFEWEGACWAVCGGTLSQEESADVEVLCPVPSAADWEATRRELASARAEIAELREMARTPEPCGHMKNYLMGDEHGHFECVVCQRDAAQAVLEGMDPQELDRCAKYAGNLDTKDYLERLATRLREWRNR